MVTCPKFAIFEKFILAFTSRTLRILMKYRIELWLIIKATLRQYTFRWNSMFQKSEEKLVFQNRQMLNPGTKEHIWLYYWGWSEVTLNWAVKDTFPHSYIQSRQIPLETLQKLSPQIWDLSTFCSKLTFS